MVVGDFKKLSEKTFPRSLAKVTPVEKYWKSFKTALVVKDNSPVYSVDICRESGDFAVASSFKVETYSSKTFAHKKTFSKFKSQVYAVNFRSDGKMVAAGDASGLIQVFDEATKTTLRELRGHASSSVVRALAFAPNKIDLWSGADDRSVRLWDVATGSLKTTFDGHTDYVRTLSLFEGKSECAVSGGYDHVVRLWDARIPSAAASFDHGAPVESVLVFPEGTLLASAGANVIRIWDVVANRQLVEIRSHQKTVLSLAYDPATRKLLAGSLDRAVKVFDSESFGVVHCIKYPFPVISLAVSSAGDAILAGSSNGSFSIKSKKSSVTHSASASADFPLSSLSHSQFSSVKKSFGAAAAMVVDGEVVVAGEEKKRFAKIDRLLRRFLHSQALQCALQLNSPGVVVTLLEELLRRSTLKDAIVALEEDKLVLLLKFLCLQLRNPLFAQILIDTVHVLLGSNVCEVGQSVAVDHQIVRLRRIIEDEISFQNQLSRIMGSLEMVLTAN